MAELILFHHAQGLTDGVRAFGDELRAAGHVVHTPDLYEGQTFAELADGIGYAEQVGFGTIVERGQRAADGLPSDIVYAGDRHLFADSSLPDYDASAAALVKERVLRFLDAAG